MADYDFYTNVYSGERIQEKAFPNLALRATNVLEALERRYTVPNCDETSRNMAICAMAEVLQAHDRSCRHTAASIGSTRVQYAQPKETLDQRLYRAAGIYLDFYRGVS